MTLLILLAVVWAFLPFFLLSFYSSLSRRVRDLERKVGSVDAVQERFTRVAEEVPTLAASPLPSPPPSVLTPRGSYWSDQLTAWLKEDWLMKLGAFLVLLGFGWFVTYAFLHDWIGPMGRIALGLIAGAGIIALGFFRIQRFANQGSVFIVLGAAVVLLTVYAARSVYGFFTPVSATALMFLSTAFVALAAVRFRVRMLAFVGLLLAGLVPLFVAGEPNYIGLFTYLAVVVLGVLWVVLLTEWRDLLVGALAILSAYSVGHWIGFEKDDIDILVLFAYGFAAIFYSANIVGFLRAQKAMQANIVASVWNGAFLLIWILAGVAEEWQSLVLAFWCVVFLLAAFLVYRVSGKREPLLSYAAVGIAFLGTATAMELDGATLGIAFTLQVAAVVFLTHLLVRERHITAVASFLFLVPGLYVLRSVVEYPEYVRNGLQHLDTPLFNEHFFLLFIFIAVLAGLGVFFRIAQRGQYENGTEYRFLARLYAGVSAAFACVLVWLFLHHFTEEGTATMLSLALYTIAGIAAYLGGRECGDKGLKTGGTILVGFVVGHLLLIDVWNMELFWRIITFLLIGALLMATAFVRKSSKQGAI